MRSDVQAYIDSIPAEQRPLFDRIAGLVMEVKPEAETVISYQMPTFKVGKRRLYLGAWSHGVSIYGVQVDRDGGLTARHPELRTGKGTIKVTEAAAALISDQEFRDLARAALQE